VTEPAQPPEPAVVEWGSERRGVLDRLTGWQHPRLSWALAVLGAVAMFGSLIGEWQVIDDPSIVTDAVVTDQFDVAIADTTVWGTGWLLGAMLLAICAGLGLAGQPAIRPYARTVGLVVAAVQLGILVAAAVNLSQDSVLLYDDETVEVTFGRGVYAAFASVLLIGAALYLARAPGPRTKPAAEPARRTGPEDLVVGPAEPLVHPTDDHTWR
jgi:hypothetical protein